MGGPVSILTSGIGLGTYIPALLVQRQIRSSGLTVDVETLESYYSLGCQHRHLAHKAAYHQDFRLAAMAQRLARSVETCLDGARIDELLHRWRAEHRTHFIVWSGFWLPILERYRRLTNATLQIDCCRIDASVSASYRAHEDLARRATSIWLWSWQEKKTIFEIRVDDRDAVDFADRDQRLVIHGGGWGIGTYRNACTELSNNPEQGVTTWELDIVVHDRAEAVPVRSGDRHFMVRPDWHAWKRSDDEHTFPPFADIDGLGQAVANGHGLYELIRRSKAIISKPGGGTLIDSLSSATPVVLLEPCGDAEASNAALWEYLGFGITFAKWRAAGYSDAVLARLHENIRRRTHHGPDYPRYFVDRMEQRTTACVSPSL
jgi:hypothetical protein